MKIKDLVEKYGEDCELVLRTWEEGDDPECLISADRAGRFVNLRIEPEDFEKVGNKVILTFG